jgi:hypothetical protein
MPRRIPPRGPIWPISWACTTPGAKEFFWIVRTTHRFESYSYFQDKPEKMLDWLASQLV